MYKKTVTTRKVSMGHGYRCPCLVPFISYKAYLIKSYCPTQVSQNKDNSNTISECQGRKNRSTCIFLILKLKNFNSWSCLFCSRHTDFRQRKVIQKTKITGVIFLVCNTLSQYDAIFCEVS